MGSRGDIIINLLAVIAIAAYLSGVVLVFAGSYVVATILLGVSFMSLVAAALVLRREIKKEKERLDKAMRESA